jgi:hypothetical protein
METEIIDRLKKGFIARCKVNQVKFESKTYLMIQAEYFIGAMIALENEHVGWKLFIMSGRSILTKEEFNS